VVIVIASLAVIEDMPEKGDIICSAPSKAAPQGFLYKVKDVKASGSETSIVTEMATIEEAVKDAYVNQSFDLIFANIEEVEGVEILSMTRAPNSLSRSTQARSTDIELTALKLKVDIAGWSLKHLELTTQPQFKLQLTAGIGGNFYAKLAVEDTIDSSKKITFSCGLEFEAKAKLKIFSNEIEEWNATFCSLDWPIWEKQWGSTAEIDKLVPPEIIDAVEDLGQTINWGYTPPNIEGTYLMAPMRKVRSNFYEGSSFGYDAEYTFYNQDIINSTIQMNAHSFNMYGYVDNSDGHSEGIGTFIVGHDNAFSIFMRAESINDNGYKCASVVVMSGELVDGGIRNFQESVIVVDDYGQIITTFINLCVDLEYKFFPLVNVNLACMLLYNYDKFKNMLYNIYFYLFSIFN
jgi:hypothetical protein